MRTFMYKSQNAVIPIKVTENGSLDEDCFKGGVRPLQVRSRWDFGTLPFNKKLKYL